MPQSKLSHWNRLAEIEFGNLYREIEQNAKNVLFVINIDIVSLTAIAVAALTKQQEISPAFTPLVFLLPLVIIMPSMILIASQLNSTARISAYLQVYHEADVPGVRWQGAIQKLRRHGAESAFELRRGISPHESRRGIWKPLREWIRKRVSQLFGLPPRFLVRSLNFLFPLLCGICIILSLFSTVRYLLICEARCVETVLSYGILYAVLASVTVLLTRHLFMSFHYSRFDEFVGRLSDPLKLTITLSAPAVAVVRRMLAGEQVTQPASGLSPREWGELMAAVGRCDEFVDRLSDLRKLPVTLSAREMAVVRRMLAREKLTQSASGLSPREWRGLMAALERDS